MSDYFDPLSFNEDEIISKELGKSKIVKKKEVQDYRRGRYRIHMRIFDGSVLHHREIRTNDLGITVKTDIGDYKLNTNWLFKQKVSLLLYPLQRLKGIHNNFYALYKKDETDPFKVNLSYPKVSGGHLKTIRESSALRDYLKSILQSKLDTRVMIIILLAIGMFGLYFLYSQGYIDLSSIRGMLNR